MEHLYPLLKSVTIFFILVIFIQLLKRQGVFNDSHQPVFNRLVTELALPVTIFSTLAVSRIHADQILAATVMVSTIAACCLLAYVACRAMKLSYGKTGALVMLAGIGSTSTMAYPLIRQTFGASSEALTLGLIIGEFGACIPYFVIGVPITAWFGSRETNQKSEAWPVVKNFFVSPIFISFLLGLIVSQVPAASSLMAGDFFAAFFGYFANGLEILVAVSLGLMLRPIDLRPILPLFLLIVGIKLFINPIFALLGANALGLSYLATEILVIESAMPSGAIAAVVAGRYGCDGALASALVIATYLVSLVTIPLMIFLLL
jgi:predicted permease